MTMSIITATACFGQLIIGVIGAEVVNHDDVESCIRFSRPRRRYIYYYYYSYGRSTISDDEAIDICHKVRA